MKKLIVAASALLAVSTLSAAVSANDEFLDTYFPDGELPAPVAPAYIQVARTTGDFTDDILYIWWDQPEQYRTLDTLWTEYYAAGSDFAEETGFGYEVKLQADCKIDNGSWQYDEVWDNFDYDYDNYEMRPAFEHVIKLPADPVEKRSMPLSYLNAIFDDESNSCFLTGALIRQTVDNDPRFRFDTEGHTFYVRYRYLLRYYKNGSSEKTTLISAWSPAASFGKKGVQSELARPKKLEAPVISGLAVEMKDGAPWIVYDLETPQNVTDSEMYAILKEGLYNVFNIDTEYRIAGGKWQDTYTEDGTVISSGHRLAAGLNDVTESSPLELRVRFSCNKYGLTSDWSNVLSINAVKWEKASDWAIEELTGADALGLIPESLLGTDLTLPITREEFAAVSVRVFEALTGEEAVIDCDNPFEDTDSEDVLKAYSAGITAGMSEIAFEPDRLLNREQAATMLTRVYKKVVFEDWTLETDGSFTKQFKKLFVKPDPFADDEDISDWAKDSVYFMNAFEIVSGMGENRFAPRNVTPEQEEIGYANATREQALLIAARMVEKLG